MNNYNFLHLCDKKYFCRPYTVTLSLLYDILYVACNFSYRELEVCQDAFLSSVLAPDWSHGPGSEWRLRHALQK